MYALNTKTGTLHIENGCTHSTRLDFKRFRTEQEAYQSEGKYIKMCKTCEMIKEKQLKNLKQ